MITDCIFCPDTLARWESSGEEGEGGKHAKVYSTYQQSGNPSGSGIRRLATHTDECELTRNIAEFSCGTGRVLHWHPHRGLNNAEWKGGNQKHVLACHEGVFKKKTCINKMPPFAVPLTPKLCYCLSPFHWLLLSRWVCFRRLRVTVSLQLHLDC